MTTPQERARVQAETQELLEELRGGGQVFGTEAQIKRRAEGLLRHMASAEEVRDGIELAILLHRALRENDALRAAGADMTLRLFIRGAFLFIGAFALGMWAGHLLAG